MPIKFTPQFTIASVIADVQKKVARLDDALVDRLQQVGEQFVNDARNNGTYHDRTANLRSSIGYIIYKDGHPINENFPGDKKDGIQKGKQTAGNVKVPKYGFCLVVVAGMDYAYYVEAKGYDVITGSSYAAKEELTRSIEFIRKNL